MEQTWSAVTDKSRKSLLVAIEKGEKITPVLSESQLFCSLLERGFTEQYLGSGSFGTVYETVLDDVALKVGHGTVDEENLECYLKNDLYGCSDDNVLDACISSVLNELGLETFPKFYGMFLCKRKLYIAMEKIKGSTYTQTQSRLTQMTKASILFQLVHSLMLAQEKLQFTHYDLIGSNILLKKVPTDILHYQVEGKSYSFSNYGWCPVIIDFGKSRINLGNSQLFNRNMLRYFKGHQYVPYSGSVDICKLLKNPTMIDWMHPQRSILSQTKGFAELTGDCKFGMSAGRPVIPPFPDYSARDIFKTDLFDCFLDM